MAKPEPRTRPCDAAARAGRLAKAHEFWTAAEDLATLEDDAKERTDACISLWVLAGVAAADVLCCARLGRHATGQSHEEAVALLASVDKSAARSLNVLLGMKTRAGYGDLGSSRADRTRAQRAATSLVEAAAAL